MSQNHEVQDGYEEFEVEAVLDRREVPTDESAVEPPAVVPPAVEPPATLIQPPAHSSRVGQAEQAMALLGQGFRLLEPLLAHLVESEKAGTSQDPPGKKKKKRCKRSAENRLRHIKCLNCSERGHIKRDCPKRNKGPDNV